MGETDYLPTAAAAGGLALIWTLESWRPAAMRPARLRHALRNLTLGALDALALALLVGPLLFAATRWVEVSNWGLLRAARLPPLLAAACAILLLDCWMYWWHRANHRVPLLWRLHSAHHSDPEMDVTTAVRFHPGEVLISSALRLLLVLLFGLALWQVLLYDALLLVVIQFHHSNIAVPEGCDRRLRLVIASPAMHRVHHSRHRPQHDRNYSSIFSFWDRACGTFLMRPAVTEFGLPGCDAEERQSLSGLLRTPFAAQGVGGERANPLTRLTSKTP